MVKKYFRPLIIAVCVMMSVSGSNTVYLFAAETDSGMTSGDAVVEQENALLPDTMLLSDDEVLESSSEEDDTMVSDVATVESTEVELPEEIPEDVPKEISDEIPEDIIEENPNESSEEPPEDNTEENMEEIPEENPDGPEEENPDEPKEETPNISVMMTQNIDTPTFADEIRQTVRVDYLTASSSRLEYNIDPSLDIKSLEIGSNTYLEGGRAVVTSDSGNRELTITAVMDLSGFSGVSKITFLPKIDAYEGMVAEFTAVLKLKNQAAGPGAENPVNSFTCGVNVVVPVNGEEQTFPASITSNVASGSVTKPSISLEYDGKTYKESISGAVEFGKDFELNLGALGMKTFAREGVYTYDVTTPDFVTLKKIRIPKLDGAKEITLYALKGENELKIGVFNPGDELEIGESGISGIRFVVKCPADAAISTNGSGKIYFSNNLETNPDGKTLNASFRASAKASIGGVDYSDSSKIITVNVKSQTRTQPDKPQTNDPGTGGGNDNPGGGDIGGGQPSDPEPTPIPEEPENNYDEERKKEEEARKEQIKKQSLQNEQEMKEKMKSILANRVSQITTDAVSDSGASTSVVSGTDSSDPAAVKDKTDKYADWDVKPIFENIIENKVPNTIQPIMESIIESLIPSDSADTIAESEEENEEKKETIDSEKKSEKTEDQKAESEEMEKTSEEGSEKNDSDEQKSEKKNK